MKRLTLILFCVVLAAAGCGSAEESIDWQEERAAMVETMRLRIDEIDRQMQSRLAADDTDPTARDEQLLSLEGEREKIEQLMNEAVGQSTANGWSSWVSSTRRTRGELEI